MLPPSLPPPEQLTDDDSRHKSIGRSQSDSSIPRRKESQVEKAFFKFLHVPKESADMTKQQEQTMPDMIDPQEQTKSSADAVDQQEQTGDMVNQEQQTKSSADAVDQQEQTGDMVNQEQQTKSSPIMTNQTESSMEIVDQQEQTRSHIDMIDQQEQTTLFTDTTDWQEQTRPDVVSQQERTKLSADVDKEKQTKLSSDMTDLQEQEKSSTDMNDHQKQTKPSTLRRQMDMDNPYMKHTLKRQYKNRQHDSPAAERTGSKRQSWSSDVSDFSHMPGTIKQFSKVNYLKCTNTIHAHYTQEQACVEEMMAAHEDVVEVLTTRMNVS